MLATLELYEFLYDMFVSKTVIVLYQSCKLIIKTAIEMTYPYRWEKSNTILAKYVIINRLIYQQLISQMFPVNRYLPYLNFINMLSKQKSHQILNGSIDTLLFLLFLFGWLDLNYIWCLLELLYQIVVNNFGCFLHYFMCWMIKIYYTIYNLYVVNIIFKIWYNVAR